MKNLKNDYDTLKKKFNLPSYEELDKDFELLYMREIFEIKRALVFVRRRMCDKIANICNVIQNIIQPNPSYPISIEESSFFAKDEKQNELIDLLKDLMFYERFSNSLDIFSTDEEEAEFIKEVYSKWNEVKPRIKEIANKMAKGWKAKKEDKKRNDYMG